jgi:small subunit ribosomal protein S4e
MHQTREQSSMKWPIPRKGTKYVAKPFSHKEDSVSVLLAVRDMLKLAQTAKEVKLMIKQKLLKVNGRQVYDYRESIKLFNLITAGKTFRLIILPTNKFSFEEVPASEARLCKVVNRRLLSKGRVQLNLHDGSNIISKDKIAVEDSVYLDSAAKVKKHVAFEKGKKVFIISGKYVGTEGTIESISGKEVKVKLNGGSTDLHADQLVVL